MQSLFSNMEPLYFITLPSPLTSATLRRKVTGAVAKIILPSKGIQGKMRLFDYVGEFGGGLRLKFMVLLDTCTKVTIRSSPLGREGNKI